MRLASAEFHIMECLESHPQGNGTAATQAYNRLVEKVDKTQGFRKSELVKFVPGAVNQRPDRFFKFHSNRQCQCGRQHTQTFAAVRTGARNRNGTFRVLGHILGPQCLKPAVLPSQRQVSPRPNPVP